MATVTLTLQVPNAQALSALYNRVLVYRSTTGANGLFEEISTPANRPLLSANQTVYPFVDSTGDASFAYAAGYFNDDTQAKSPIGPPVMGAGSPAAGFLSVADLKAQYLAGLDMNLPDGTPIPDATFALWISRAVAAFERATGVTVQPTIVSGETHDLVRSSRPGAAPRFKTHKVPVQRITKVVLTLPLTQPQTIPLDWATVERNSGRVTFYPTSNLSYADSVMGGVPWRFMIFNQPMLPNAWAVDYVAGFPFGQAPPEVADVIGKMASAEPLRVAGDLLGGAGRSGHSLGLDGVSQSVSLVRSGQGGVYSARLMAYAQDIQTQLDSLRAMYRGILYGTA